MPQHFVGQCRSRGPDATNNPQQPCREAAYLNLVLETRLNGEDVGFSLIGVPCDPENPAGFHTHWNEFEIIGGLQAGENELQFITQNTKGLCAHSFQAGWRCELVCVPYDPEEGTDHGD